MNVGELLRERDRLLSIIEEAKTAKTKLRQLNTLIALYGDDEKVSTNGTIPTSLLDVHPETCDICGHEAKNKRGLGVHRRIVHDVLSDSETAKRQRAAKKAGRKF
jgi:hypothetical protein